MSSKLHVMLDLETLGTKPGCPIVSIGACTFDREGVGDYFYRKIDISSTNLKAEPETIKWWLKQSAEAREAFEGGIPHKRATDEFKVWWLDNGCRYVWSHGASFDPPVLTAAIDIAPWKFWDIRDTRTLYELAGIQPDRKTGTAHNALDDAINQAKAAIGAINKLGWPKQW